MPLRKLALAFLLLPGVSIWSQEQKPPEPPEEDESLAAKEYSFNPLQADKELKVGNFYFKKGNYRAAAARYREAIKWSEGFAEAYWRLGEAHEKMKNTRGAREAYQKCLDLEPDGKHADEIKKKLARMVEGSGQ